MSASTMIWSMAAAAAATLGILYGSIWLSRRHLAANAWFTLMALATAAMALGDLALMHAESPAQWSWLARWYHVPVFVVVVAAVWFVRAYLQAGRLWLAWSVCLLRGLSLVLNFTTGENLNFRHVTSLHRLTFLGEPVVRGDGERNLWMLLAQASLLVLLVFVVDASIQAWRRGDHRRAALVGGAIVFFVLTAPLGSILTLWGFIDVPIIPSISFLGVVVVMGFELGRDVLRTERLEIDVREGEQRLALAAEAANLGVWMRDASGDGIWASDHWRRIFGFEREEPLTFERILQRVHPDDRGTVRQSLQEPRRADGGYEMEYRLVLPDGRMRWIVSRGRFEPGDSQAQILTRGVSVDVTARRQAERDLEERRAELTHLSRVAMLGELSGSLAHELNQPLTAILSNAQAAQRFLARPEIDRVELEEILRDIVEADQRAGEIIRSLHALFKKGEMSRVPLEVNALVQEVLRLIRSDVLNRHVTLVSDLGEGLPAILADRVQLQQVLINLILNAVDALQTMSDDGARFIRVTTRRAEDRVCIAVRDHGPGIAPEILSRVFEPFYSTKEHGLGLGLTVCRSIVTAHQGSLEAGNHPDGGAEFSVFLPVDGGAK